MPMTAAFLRTRLTALRAQHTHAGNFCFFTDTENLPSIIQRNRLLCRTLVKQNNLLQRDCASHDVLNKTPAWVHEHVRLYFAPLTPMLYQIEGIKRQPDSWPECPRPVYLVFAPEVLLLPGVQLSDGNMGSKYSNCAEASDAYFGQLPFDDIFHRGPVPLDQNMIASVGFDPNAKDKQRRRHAEVLVPKELELRYLRQLVFRSDAERDLAQMDVRGFPGSVAVSVRPDWFFARTRYRPYMEHFNAETGFTVANPLIDDSVVFIGNKAGVLQAQKCDYVSKQDGQGWSDWVAVDANDFSYNKPPVGRAWYYLYGHRVADVPYL